MKTTVDLKFLIEEVIEISGRYLPGYLDSFYYEIKDNLNETGIVDKKDILKAIKNCKNVDLEHFSDIRVSFYYWVKEINQRYYQISV